MRSHEKTHLIRFDFDLLSQAAINIDVSYNALTGALLPGVFSNLRVLSFLSLRHNSVTAIADGALAALPELEILDIAQNSITVLGRGTLRNLTTLTTLWAWVNLISVLEPGVFDDCAGLREVLLSNNLLRGPVPDVFRSVPLLHTIGLADNPLYSVPTGTWPPNLRDLDLSNCALEAILPGMFSNLSRLSYVELAGNYIMHVAPGSFDGVGGLDMLDLEDNFIEELDASALAGAGASLSVLMLSGNLLSAVPELLAAGLPGLTQLEVEFNALEGPIPPCLCELASLRILKLSFNELFSTIPECLLRPQLNELSLGSNYLYGTLSPLFAATSMFSLDVSYNTLSGELPPWVGDMEMLRFLDISQNFMTGDVAPGTLAPLKSLEYFNDEGNCGMGAPRDPESGALMCTATVCIVEPQRPPVRCVPRTPAVPANASVVAVPGGASVRWAPPLPSHAVYSPVRSYTIIAYEVEGGGVAAVITAAPNATRAALTSLTNGVSYAVTVAAVNDMGVGTASSRIGFMPASHPEAPSGVNAAGLDGGASVSWVAPPYAGSALRLYELAWVPPDAGGGSTVDGLATSATLAGLVLDGVYTFRVRGSNAAGPGDWSLPSAPVAARAPGLVLPSAAAAAGVLAGAAAYAAAWGASRRRCSGSCCGSFQSGGGGISGGGGGKGPRRDYTAIFGLTAAVYQVICLRLGVSGRNCLVKVVNA